MALNATGSDAATGGATIAAAEYFIDGSVVNGAGTTMTLNNPAAVTTALSAVIPYSGLAIPPAGSVDALSEGPHTVRVHARDSVGNWGPATSIALLDRQVRPDDPRLGRRRRHRHAEPHQWC